MSIKVMNYVWDLELPPHLKVVMLKLADNANEETGLCCPSVPLLAKKCCISERTCFRNLAKLREMGLITSQQRIGSRGQISSEYRFPGYLNRHDRLSPPDLTDCQEPPQNEGTGLPTATGTPLTPVSCPLTSLKPNHNNMSRDSSDKSDMCREVFDYWVKVMGKNPKQVKFTAERKTKIKQRLKDYPIEDIKRAIDGCRSSAHHQGENPSKTKYNDIELICRTGSKLEAFRDMTSANSTENLGWYV